MLELLDGMGELGRKIRESVEPQMQPLPPLPGELLHGSLLGWRLDVDRAAQVNNFFAPARRYAPTSGRQRRKRQS
jgi:hypothetical protein